MREEDCYAIFYEDENIRVFIEEKPKLEVRKVKSLKVAKKDSKKEKVRFIRSGRNSRS